MTNFAVLRFAKIISLKGLAGASAHNARTASCGLDHADSRAPLMGGGVQRLAGRDDAVEMWHERAKAVGLAKPRKDAVRALEVVISVSPEWFAQSSLHDRTSWRDRSMAWAGKTFGDENVLSAHLHDDEGSPHLHLLVIPLAQKQRKRAGRPRKGRKVHSQAAVASWGLSAADLIGSPAKLTELQTSYAAKVADLGIRRGRPRRVTGAQHRSAVTYRSEAAELLDATHCDRIEAMNELSSAKGAKMFAQIDAEQVLTTAQQSAADTAIAFTIGLDAIDGGELVYSPGSNQKPAGLNRQKVENPCLPIDRSGFQSWLRAVQPLISRLVGYAYRLRCVSMLEKNLTMRGDDLAVEAGAILRVAERQAANEKIKEGAEGIANQDAAILVRGDLTRKLQVRER